MLYTIVPLENIYSNRTKSILDDYMVANLSSGTPNSRTNTEFRNIPIAYGSVTASRRGDKYLVNQVKSTDMSDYLNEKYSPGSEIDIF